MDPLLCDEISVELIYPGDALNPLLPAHESFIRAKCFNWGQCIVVQLNKSL